MMDGLVGLAMFIGIWGCTDILSSEFKAWWVERQKASGKYYIVKKCHCCGNRFKGDKDKFRNNSFTVGRDYDYLCKNCHSYLHTRAGLYFSERK